MTDTRRDQFSPSFAYLSQITDRFGVFEHASFRTPRVEHGYCTDDVARALTVVVREHSTSAEMARLTETYTGFLERAISWDGRAHNRLSSSGQWRDSPQTNDWWGRAIGGLGNAVFHAIDPRIHDRALVAFHRAAQARSVDVRASSFAAVGASRVLSVYPGDLSARALLQDCLAAIPRRPAPGWGWIEPRLRYANAALCDALIVGGDALDEPETIEQGLAALTALFAIETGHTGFLSVTGPNGRSPSDRGPLWDQQPIEPATMAEACIHAAAISGDSGWERGVLLAWGWFMGDNDARMPMCDPVHGWGFDGLEPGGRNENCGAESTIAALSTLQHRRALEAVSV